MYLTSRPAAARIVDYEVTTTPGGDATVVTTRVAIEGTGSTPPGGSTVVVRLLDRGAIVQQASADVPVASVAATAPCATVRVGGWRRSVEVTLRIDSEALRLWSPDSPALYTVAVTLRAPTGVLQAEACSVGLRTIAITDRHGGTPTYPFTSASAEDDPFIALNGGRAQFRGANRHDHDAWLGDAVRATSVLAKATVVV